MSLLITEDTPPDMLAGSMDLKVILPNGETVKMSVQRGTPMMDLLVQVTTAHCLNPGDYSLQAMGERGVLPFKPSTPIGALETFTVKIVGKKLQSRGRAPQVPQSFLNSFRLQVHLPRSQLFVLRVTPDITLSEIMNHVCTEKNLNLEKYEFRNPNNLEEVLDLEKNLGDYKLQELSMVNKSNRIVTGLMSSADIINVKSSKHRQNSICESSLSSGSFGSRSGSPIPAINIVTIPPQPPLRRKRRPAPKPPSFRGTEKKDQTTESVLISHSRESSDSSGYHEASLLSESPTHGAPANRMENNSPPDTLPRRGKLPPSQSFTNLTSIQPAPKTRLTNSVSNTSLNSTGHSRKKRAPPPPQTQIHKEDKIKSSTLPTSITEERRNSSTFMTENAFLHTNYKNSEELSDAKVQCSVQISSESVNETKASRDETSVSVDVDVRLPPKPKPRTTLSSMESTLQKLPKLRNINNVVALDLNKNPEDSHQPPSINTLSRWNNLENLNEEEVSDVDTDILVKGMIRETSSTNKSTCKSKVDSVGHFGCKTLETEKNTLLTGNTDVQEDPPPVDNEDQGDQDSINWEYQLPPPPTDFRDTHSPSCTEFGTITITPEVLENFGEEKKETKDRLPKGYEEEKISQRSLKLDTNEIKTVQRIENDNHGSVVDSNTKISQTKFEVMNELTNILNEQRKCKEKSLSVSNLYINDSNSKDFKKNALNYSKSFSTDPVSSLSNFKLTTYTNGIQNNNKLSNSNEVVYNEITYKNYKNLEKSSSMECIQTKNLDNHKFTDRSDDIFQKPIAPVQKKLKVARRSVSSIGVNTSNSQKRNSEINQHTDSWSEDSNINILREQFLEFLKEKKLMNNDLNMKSLDVIRNILPELNGEKGVKNSNSHINVVVNNKNETSNHENAQFELKNEDRRAEDKVKIVDVMVKSSPVVEENSQDQIILRHDNNKTNVKAEVAKRESLIHSSPERKHEVGKRYSYQGPPSINFGTWGERPKTTTIIIKDEDYVTHDKVTQKKSEMSQNVVNKNVEIVTSSTPKKLKKPQIVIKKPGVLSHYEMFSALPKKKEISSLELVHIEDEEKKKKMENPEAKEFNRVPVVCGVELKKEFKNNNGVKHFTEPLLEPEVSKPKHSVSVYINGNQDVDNSKPLYNFILPKRNSAVMPVVKGFRPLEENVHKNHINISHSSTTNHIKINANNKKDVINNEGVTINQKSPLKRQSNGTIPPPPLPNISLIKMKPVSLPEKSKSVSQDPRGQLLEEIRNFGGSRKLKKSTVR